MELDARPAERAATGRFALWWLLVQPLAVQWHRAATANGVDRAVGAVVLVLIVWVAAVRPRWTIPVAVAGVAWIQWIAADALDARMVVSFTLVTALWGYLTGAIVVPGGPPRRLLWPTGAVMVGIDVLFLVRSGLYLKPAVVALVAAAVAAVAPTVTARLLAPFTPITDLVERAGRDPWRRFRAGCAATTRARRRWWNGDLPASAATGDLGPVALAPAPEGRWHRYRVPTLWWLGTVLVINASRMVAPPPEPWPDRGWFNPTSMREYFVHPDSMLHWLRWDSTHYLDIARNGYHYEAGRYITEGNVQQPAAWLPGYGLLIRALTAPFELLLGADTVDQVDLHGFVAVLIAVASGLTLTLLFWRWMAQHRVDGHARLVGLLCLLWFPYSFILGGAGYSDQLFAALVVGSLVLVTSDRPWASGLAGAGATLVRINGLSLVLGLFGHAATAPREHRRRLAVAPLLALCGIGGYVVWCWVRYDEPLLYWNAHKAIFGKMDPSQPEQVLKFNFFPSIARRWGDQRPEVLNLLAEAAITVGVGLSVPAVRRRFGIAAAGLVAGQVAMIWLGSYDFIGAGRYLVCAVPVAALWGEWLAADGRGRQVARRALAAIGIGCSLVLTYHFTQAIDLGW